MKRMNTLRSVLVWLLAALLGLPVKGWAQHESKYSASTLMFLDERDGITELPKVNQKPSLKLKLESLPFTDKGVKRKPLQRPIAQAEDVNGTQMISAFVALSDNNYSALEGLGVLIEAKFDKLATTLIPVNKIEDVAALTNVKRIEVAEILETHTDLSRSATQAIDAIVNSSAAQALGLTSSYTGKGIVLGIVDSGIDFQHIAFKDKNGNSRIKRAYKLQSSTSTSLTTYSSASQISGLTYDTQDGDHGTHTSTTAGGSSVIVSGSSVTVTDDHANATYGGMAPEADLVIAGLSSLYTTSIGTAIQNICNYADQEGKPCVISLSLGSQTGPHDGTGSIASIVNQCAGNNHIIVYAASNDGMRADPFVQIGTSNGGGMYASGMSTSAKPMIVNVQRAFEDADGNVEMLMPTICAYARTPNVATSLKFHVVNVNTGAIVYSSSAYSASTTITVTGTTGLAKYFKCPSTQYSNQYGDAGKIRLVRTQDTNNNKYYWQIYCPVMLSTSYNDDDGDGIYNGDYAFCVSIYPTSSSSSTIIDMWESYASWFGTDLNLSSTSYNYCPGNDECSVSDNATYPNVISVGAYVTRNSFVNSAGNVHDSSADYPNIGDHASFSSWQTAGYGPLGTALPHINAPGARIIAGVNHYHTASIDDYSYYGDADSYYGPDLVVNNANYPYAAMEGTSMATPCVSGIIAQWLQACVEAGKTANPDYIKEVMAATWDTDQWTDGTGSGAHGAKTFGTHGKINAVKGIQYILGVTGGPSIKASSTEVALAAAPGQTLTEEVTVTGLSLEDDITVTISGDESITVNKTAITSNEGSADAVLTITYAPTVAGTHTATVTLSTLNAEDVVISVTGTATVPELLTTTSALALTAETGETVTGVIGLSAANLTGDVTVSLDDAEGVFSLSTTSITKTAAEDNAQITVTFAPTAAGTYTGTVTLSSDYADSVVVTLTGTAVTGLPKLFVDKNALNYTAGVNEMKTQTVAVTARNLTGDVTAILSGNTGVFSVSPTTLTAAEAMAGGTFTVTFTSALAGTFAGTLTIASEGASPQAVSLSATIDEGPLVIYKLVSTMTSGKEYVLVNRNSAGSGYGLGHSGTSIATDAVTVLSDSELGTYIAAADVDATSAWAAAANSGKFTLKNGSYYVGMSSGMSRKLAISTSSTSWTYADNQLYCSSNSIFSSRTYYVSYSSNTFSLSTTAGNIYIYEKTEIPRTYPTLVATPTELAFEAEKGATATATFTVSAADLTDDITLTLSQEGTAFSLSQTTVGPDEAAQGKTVTVTFAPDSLGTFAATLTLSTSGTSDFVINLVGRGFWAGQQGDVVRDDSVNTTDVQAIAAILAGRDPEEELYDHIAADMDKDGKVTLSDITALVNYLREVSREEAEK